MNASGETKFVSISFTKIFKDMGNNYIGRHLPWIVGSFRFGDHHNIGNFHSKAEKLYRKRHEFNSSSRTALAEEWRFYHGPDFDSIGAVRFSLMLATENP